MFRRIQFSICSQSVNLGGQFHQFISNARKLVLQNIDSFLHRFGSQCPDIEMALLELGKLGQFDQRFPTLRPDLIDELQVLGDFIEKSSNRR